MGYTSFTEFSIKDAKMNNAKITGAMLFATVDVFKDSPIVKEGGKYYFIANANTKYQIDKKLYDIISLYYDRVKNKQVHFYNCGFYFFNIYYQLDYNSRDEIEFVSYDTFSIEKDKHIKYLLDKYKKNNNVVEVGFIYLINPEEYIKFYDLFFYEWVFAFSLQSGKIEIYNTGEDGEFYGVLIGKEKLYNMEVVYVPSKVNTFKK